MINVIEIYNIYCNSLEKENYNKRYKDNGSWFKASSSGSCILKHRFALKQQKFMPVKDEKVRRKLRLGNIVHDDFEKALNWAKEKNMIPEGTKVFTELCLELPEYNVRGHLDILIVENDEVFLIDLKTMASWPWTRKFGLKKNRDPNPHKLYELQLGTYGIWVGETYGIPKMSNLYYKKDDSTIRSVNIPEEWIKHAKEYWIKVNKTIDEAQFGSPLCPAYSWECKGCNHLQKCNTQYRR